MCVEADPRVGNDHERDEESHDCTLIKPEHEVDDPHQRTKGKQKEDGNHKEELLFHHSVEETYRSWDHQDGEDYSGIKDHRSSEVLFTFTKKEEGFVVEVHQDQNDETVEQH